MTRAAGAEDGDLALAVAVDVADGEVEGGERGRREGGAVGASVGCPGAVGAAHDHVVDAVAVEIGREQADDGDAEIGAGLEAHAAALGETEAEHARLRHDDVDAARAIEICDHRRARRARELGSELSRLVAHDAARRAEPACAHGPARGDAREACLGADVERRDRIGADGLRSAHGPGQRDEARVPRDQEARCATTTEGAHAHVRCAGPDGRGRSTGRAVHHERTRGARSGDLERAVAVEIRDVARLAVERREVRATRGATRGIFGVEHLERAVLADREELVTSIGVEVPCDHVRRGAQHGEGPALARAASTRRVERARADLDGGLRRAAIGEHHRARAASTRAHRLERPARQLDGVAHVLAREEGQREGRIERREHVAEAQRRLEARVAGTDAEAVAARLDVDRERHRALGIAATAQCEGGEREGGQREGGQRDGGQRHERHGGERHERSSARGTAEGARGHVCSRGSQAERHGAFISRTTSRRPHTRCPTRISQARVLPFARMRPTASWRSCEARCSSSP